MRKSILRTTIFLTFMVLILTISVSAEWIIDSSEDQMTGDVIWYAHSSPVNSTEKMGFPYQNTKSRLVVGNDGKSEWVYIDFNTNPNISNDEIEDGYSIINTRVKWDEKIENMTLVQKWGSKSLHFKNYSTAISKIEKSNTVLVELKWYGEGSVYFRYSLKGSAAAIQKIRDKF